MDSNVLIYNASAGAGKTYQLTKHFLLKLLGSSSTYKIREILAVTFTNKAVKEMKERFVEALQALSLEYSPKKYEPLLNELAAELDLEPNVLRNRAKKHLQFILYHYSFFDVVTLDAFATRLMKSYQTELGIPSHFEIEIDHNYLIKETALRLMEIVGIDDQITKILIRFSENKLEDGKNFDVVYNLVEHGNLLFQENHYPKIVAFSEKTTQELETLRSLVFQRIDEAQQQIKIFTQELLDHLETAGIEDKNFTGSYLPKFLRRVLVENTPPTPPGGQYWQNPTVSNLTRSKEAYDKIEAILPSIISFKEKFLAHKGKHNFYQQVRKRYGMQLLSVQFYKAFKTLLLEKEILPLAEVNKLINLIVHNEEIPVIYERIGERYKHFLFDEFQDTSTVQWENFIPLIANVISGENLSAVMGSLFLVGDAKQALYRFRGGDTQQFIDLFEGRNYPFTVDAQCKTLSQNWRSGRNIVNFNNHFFEETATDILQLHGRDIYLGKIKQVPMSDEEGYVQVDFIPESEKDQVPENALMTHQHIKTILEKGYTYADICVVVRKKTQAEIISNHLLENNVPVITEKSQLLSTNQHVTLLIAFFKWYTDQENQDHYFDLFCLLSDEKDTDEFLKKHKPNPKRFFQDQFKIDFSTLAVLGVFHTTEYLIEKFYWHTEPNAYLSFFLDYLYKLEKQKANDIISFLEEWEIQKEKIAVKIPESTDAVKIMTIHKSKGLEFPFVIIPYLDSKIVDSKNNDFWMPVKKEEHEGVQELLVNWNKSLEHYPSSLTPHPYHLERENIVLDTFNGLYVAMTRPKKGLFVIANEKNKETLSSLFETHLASRYHHSTIEPFVLGEITPAREAIKITHQPTILKHRIKWNTSIWGEKISVNQNRIAAQETGNAVHEILGKIYHQKDMSQEIQLYFLLNPHWSYEEREKIENRVSAVVMHPEISKYFKTNLVVKNEIDILVPGQGILRPDKLIIDEKNITLIDFKTGDPREEDETQVNEYESCIKNMGYTIIKKLLVYTNDTITLKTVE